KRQGKWLGIAAAVPLVRSLSGVTRRALGVRRAVAAGDTTAAPVANEQPSRLDCGEARIGTEGGGPAGRPPPQGRTRRKVVGRGPSLFLAPIFVLKHVALLKVPPPRCRDSTLRKRHFCRGVGRTPGVDPRLCGGRRLRAVAREPKCRPAHDDGGRMGRR